VRTLAAFGIAPREALFIGDGSLDTAAAVRADVPHALIGDDDTSPNGAEWTLASLQELPALVDKLLDSGGREGR
jgi:phosphoglycolate phosphatase-like HAD superfamily hydrolase